MLANLSSMIAHPDYNSNDIDSDVGIMKLMKNITGDDDTKLPNLASKGFDPRAGSTNTVAGW